MLIATSTEAENEQDNEGDSYDQTNSKTATNTATKDSSILNHEVCLAVHAISVETVITNAFETSRGVFACGVAVTVVEELDTLIDILALVTINNADRDVAGVACTVVASDIIRTQRISGTLVVACVTLIDVIAMGTITAVAMVTSTGEATIGVIASGGRVAVVVANLTFIIVNARYTIARVPSVASTGELSNGIRARSVSVAVVVACVTLIDVIAMGTITAVAVVTGTCEATFGI